MSVSVYDNLTGTQPYFYRTLTSNSTTEIVDLVCEPLRIYYFVLENATGGTPPFSVRLRQFTATYHSNNRGDLTAEQGMNAILDSSAEAGWFVTNKLGMTVSRAKQETNALTGYRDFDSEIFVYGGHGDPGLLYYEQPSSASTALYFWADYLPDMSHCELVVWAACCSALESPSLGMSMVSQSIEMGAKTAIGWSINIGDVSANTYLNNLFTALASGYTVYEASQQAIKVSNFASTNKIITCLVLAGDAGNCLLPRRTMQLVAPADMFQTMEYNAIDATKYTLVAENESCGVKLYTRMLNGIPTDDFYLEFYNMEGEYTGMRKSSYTLDEATVSQFETAHAAFLEGKTAAEKEGFVYTYINGELHLTTREVCESENGACTTVYTDAVSGEILQ